VMVAPSGPNLAMFVLDAMQDDIEDLASVMRYLIEWRPYWTHEYSEGDVMAALVVLIEDGLVDVYGEAADSAQLVPIDAPRTDEASLRHYWFGPTPKGRRIWKEWDAPSLPE
jgi:hypothetical protein